MLTKLSDNETDPLNHSSKKEKWQSISWRYDVYAPALFGWIIKNACNAKDAETILVNTFVTAEKNIEQFKLSKLSFLIWLVQLSNQESSSFYKMRGIHFKMNNLKTSLAPDAV